MNMTVLQYQIQLWFETWYKIKFLGEHTGSLFFAGKDLLIVLNEDGNIGIYVEGSEDYNVFLPCINALKALQIEQ